MTCTSFVYSPNAICYKIGEKICDQFNNAFILMVSEYISFSLMFLASFIKYSNFFHITCNIVYHKMCNIVYHKVSLLSIDS